MDFLILGAASPAASIGQTLFWLLPMFAIVYFLIIRPQNQRMKKHRAMVEALKRGDKVVTQGGMIGKVTKVADDRVTIELSDGVKADVVRTMIADILNPVATNEAPGTKKK